MKTLNLLIIVLVAISIISCEKEEYKNKLPDIPVLLEPIDGSIMDSDTIVFKWQCTDIEDDYIIYTISISKDLVNWDDISSHNTSVSLSLFEKGQKYYWKVKAENSLPGPNPAQEKGESVSEVFYFYTTPPGISALRDSSGHEFVNLFWEDPIDIDYIEIYFEPEISNMAQPIIADAGTEKLELTGMVNGTLYTFYLNSYNNLGHKSETATIKALPLDPTQVHDADFNIYNIIKIGEQTWLRENLRTTRWQDGSPIIDNLNRKGYKIINQSDIYGYYYHPHWTFGEGAEGKNPCPRGYHVPSDEEWQDLERYLGMPEDEVNRYSSDISDFYRGEDLDIGNILKTTSGWDDDYYGVDGNGIDFYMFNNLPAGSIWGNSWSGGGEYSYLYSSTLKYDKEYTCRVFSNSSSGIGRYSYYDINGSIRCIKD